MGMKLEKVVPWGRNINEYRAMFMLSDDDMKKRIAGFGAIQHGHIVFILDLKGCFMV